MTTLLTTGEVHTLTQNQVYALPARAVKVLSSAAVEVSMNGSTNWAVLANSTTGAETLAPFLRSTLANTLATVK